MFIGEQTLISHEDPILLRELQKFKDICKPTQIYNAMMMPYDMSEFK